MTRVGIVIGSLLLGFFPLLALAADEHIAASPDSLKWGPVPDVFPKGAELAVIAGDPGKAEPFVIRFKAPAGYKVAAHTHPIDENVTVISGTFHLGMGEKFDQAKGTLLKAGGFAKLPPGRSLRASAKASAASPGRESWLSKTRPSVNAESGARESEACSLLTRRK